MTNTEMVRQHMDRRNVWTSWYAWPEVYTKLKCSNRGEDCGAPSVFGSLERQKGGKAESWDDVLVEVLEGESAMTGRIFREAPRRSQRVESRRTKKAHVRTCAQTDRSRYCCRLKTNAVCLI